MVEVKCNVCGKEHKVTPSRAKSYVACSIECLSKIRKSPPNCVCKYCKKDFYLKNSAIIRYNRSMGTFCSQKCASEHKKQFYLGSNNPNFKGVMHENGYILIDYPKIGKVKEHRYVVHSFYGVDKLPNGCIVHHKNCIKTDNRLENLQLMTNSDHKWLHKQFGNATLWACMSGKISIEEISKWSECPENAEKLLGECVLNQKIGIFKQGELLENPEMGNQHPSLSSNTFEGSTTNTRVRTDSAEDGNSDTSALPQIILTNFETNKDGKLVKIY